MDDLLRSDDHSFALTTPVNGDLSQENTSDADIKEVDCQSVVETCKKEEVDFDPTQNSHDGLCNLADGNSEAKKSSEIKKGTDLKGNTKKERKLDVKVRKPDVATHKKGGIVSTQVIKAKVTRSVSLIRSSTKQTEAQEEIGIAAGVISSDHSPLRKSLGGSLSRSNFTVPQPFALATDKRASIGLRPSTAEGPQSHQFDCSTGMHELSAAKDTQVMRKTRPKACKALHEEDRKHVEDKNASLEEQKVDDDDVQSVSSVTSRSTRVKCTVAVNASSFSFKCDERAEKRKQFYTKLEELHIAKEEERNQIQAKTKEEMEAEIKELRKNLTFKASPMPSFYKEGTPPKVDLKKIPTKRAKSPKLGRRSSIGIHSENPGENAQCNVDGNLEKVSDKNSMERSKKSVRRSLPASGSEKFMKSETEKLMKIRLSESNEDDTPNITDESEINIQKSVETKVRETLKENVSVSASSHASDEVSVAELPLERIKRQEEGGACLHETNVESGYVDGSQHSDALDFEADCKGQMAQNSVLNEEVKTTDENDSIKVMSLPANEPANEPSFSSGRGAHQALKQAAQASKSGKKEKLKASTPTFRTKKAPVTNPLPKHAARRDHGLSLVATEIAASS